MTASPLYQLYAIKQMGRCPVRHLQKCIALLGFERWQSANIGLPLGSVKYHLGTIGGVEASRTEDVFDGIDPSRFGANSWSFPAMNVWVEVIDPSGGRMACGGDIRTSVGMYNTRGIKLGSQSKELWLLLFQSSVNTVLR